MPVLNRVDRISLLYAFGIGAWLVWSVLARPACRPDEVVGMGARCEPRPTIH